MVTVVGRIQAHHCDLPKKGWPWNRNPLCTRGTVIQCEVCKTYWRWGKDYSNFDGFDAWCWMDPAKVEEGKAGNGHTTVSQD